MGLHKSDSINSRGNPGADSCRGADVFYASEIRILHSIHTSQFMLDYTGTALSKTF